MELQSDKLINIIYKNDIKDSYLELLSQLTTVEKLSDEVFFKRITDIHKMGDIIIFYYEYDNNIKLVGTGTIIYEPKIIHGGKYVGHIEEIVVNKDYRKQGIGKKIIKKLVELSYTKNCYKVILDCNDELVPFYENLGFKNKNNQMSLYNTYII